jgi:hypothetical protein
MKKTGFIKYLDKKIGLLEDNRKLYILNGNYKDARITVKEIRNAMEDSPSLKRNIVHGLTRFFPGILRLFYPQSHPK